MRLTEQQIRSIKVAATQVFTVPVTIWLFGSRVDDTLRGGDIDLMVESQQPLQQRAQLLCRFSAELMRRLGDRKIDLILKDPQTPETAIIQQIYRSGIPL